MSTRGTYRMKECDICKDEHSESTKSCEACHKVVKKYQNKTKYSMEEVRKALKNAHPRKDREKKESYFECKYTGMVGKFNTQNKTLGTYEDALVLTLDHENPEDKKNSPLVVSLNIINKMKADIPFDDFKKVVIALGEHFKDDTNPKKLEKELKQIFCHSPLMSST